jgi:2-polyprenyl-3-methyl-5-hydroxy-6-metoxy-1,4-benzoquinol methylase
MESSAGIRRKHTKSLDIRKHKKDWLDVEFLKRMQSYYREFAAAVLSHKDRRTVSQCCICKSRESLPIGASHGIPYRQCAVCTHIFAQIVLREVDLLAYYKAHYFSTATSIAYLNRDDARNRLHELLTPKVSFVSDFVRTARRRWLDVGAGQGGIVSCAQAMGFDAAGLELGSDAIEFGRSVLGVSLEQHTIDRELKEKGRGSCDVVSYFMVLEHVADPVEQVRYAAEILAPDGLLVVEVPTGDSVSAMGDLAFPNQGLRQLVVEHIMNYTTKSVTHLVEHNGFVVEGLWFLGQDIFNTIMHLAMQVPGFLETRLCDFFLDNSDAFQRVIDEKELSDEVIVVARKKRNVSA